MRLFYLALPAAVLLSILASRHSRDSYWHGWPFIWLERYQEVYIKPGYTGWDTLLADYDTDRRLSWHLTKEVTEFSLGLWAVDVLICTTLVYGWLYSVVRCARYMRRRQVGGALLAATVVIALPAWGLSDRLLDACRVAEFEALPGCHAGLDPPGPAQLIDLWPGAAPRWLIYCAWVADIDDPDAAKLQRAARLPFLKSINLTNVSPQVSLDPIAIRTRLESLAVEGVGLADDLLAPLEHLRHLTDLEIVGGIIGEQSNQTLSGFIKLTTLHFENCQVKRLDFVRSLPRLRWLTLKSCTIDDNQWEALEEAKRLQGIQLTDNPLPPAAFDVLGRMTWLEYLDLHGTNASDEQIDRLATALHKTSINR